MVHVGFYRTSQRVGGKLADVMGCRKRRHVFTLIKVFQADKIQEASKRQSIKFILFVIQKPLQSSEGERNITSGKPIGGVHVYGETSLPSPHRARGSPPKVPLVYKNLQCKALGFVIH